MADKIQEWRDAGFSDAAISDYIQKKTPEWTLSGFSGEAISEYLGTAKIYANEQEANSLLQRVRNYVGISDKPKKPEPTKIDESLRGQLDVNFPGQWDETTASMEADVEARRVLVQGVSGLTGGLSELAFGRVERPQTTVGTLAGAGLELAGFIGGPFKAAKVLTGTRLAPTATGLKGVAQLLAEGGAQLGIASGLSRIIPAFLENPDFGSYAVDMLKSTAMGALTGVIYPIMGVVPTQPLRVATTLAVMDKIRAGTGQWFTFDDFVAGIKDGTVDKKELASMAFNYLMDLYFASKTPSMRVQVKALENNAMMREIRSLDSDRVAQTILDISNSDSIDKKVKELGLTVAEKYNGQVYEGKPGEIHAQVIERNGLPYDASVTDGYTDKAGNFHAREEIIAPLRDGEGIQPVNMRESLPEQGGIRVYRATEKTFDKSLVTEDGIFVVSDKWQAEAYLGGKSKILETLILDKDVKILKFEDTPRELYNKVGNDYIPRDNGDGVEIAKYAKEHGYDAVEYHAQKGLAPEMSVVNPNVLKTNIGPVMFEAGGFENPLEGTLKYGPEKEMAQAGTESMIEKGIERDPKKLMSEQLAEEFLADPTKYKDIANKYGMTVEEFAKTLKEQASTWGRKLGELGLEAQKLGRENPEIAELIGKMARLNKGITAWDIIRSKWKMLDQIRRGLLVTQLSTSVRNFETQMQRVSLDVFEKGLDAGLQKIMGKEITTSPMDGVEQLVDVLRRDESKELTKTVLEHFPKEYDRLYGSYMADLETGKVGNAVARGVDILNTVNRFQEFLVRNGVFRATLEQGLERKGMNLTEIIDKNQIGAIPEKFIADSVQNALEKTFAAAPKKGGVGDVLVKFVNNFPGASFIMPFPRFFVNSTKFVFEYNPTGFLKLLSKPEREAIANGDMHVLSRATLGTIMLGMAYLFRDSEYAGEKWYEIQVGDKVIDTRPFNPFASYLFMADVTRKLLRGEEGKLTSKDIMLGIFSSNMRAGMGLYAMDQVINGVYGWLSRTGEAAKWTDLIKSSFGEVAGGLLTPFNQVKEFLGGFSDYIVREKRTDPFWGPIKEKLPWLESTLPELYTPTKEGPVIRELPIVRQLTGLATRTKTVFEKELDRLGFEYAEIFHSTGNPEADNLIKKYMGQFSTAVMEPFVSSKEFKELGDGQKGYIISEMLGALRQAGKGAAEAENPNLFIKLFFEHVPKREKAMMQELGIDLKAMSEQVTGEGK